MPKYGWSKVGDPCYTNARRHGVKMHIVVATCKYGLLGYMIRESRVDGPAYKLFLGTIYNRLK